MWAAQSNQALILTYHSISGTGPPLAIPPDLFMQQMEWLAAHASVVRLREVAEMLRTGTQLPAQAVVLTFDDALGDFASQAAPVLANYGLPATVFVPTGWCGLNDDWYPHLSGSPAKPLMSWSQIRALSNADVEFGSHTVSHARLTELTDSEIDRELADSKRRLECELGRTVELFAFPYGDWSPQLRDRVRQHYKAACTTDLARVTAASDLCSLPRIDVHYVRSWHRFRSLCAGGAQGYLRLRDVGRRCRRALVR